MKKLVTILLFSCFLPVNAFAETKTVVFAGGCFWCMQPPFDALKTKGVISTSVGYSGGRTEDPTYEKTSAGGTGHFEVIQVTYDSSKINLKELLPVFWKNIDPFDEKGQFCDKGEQYSSAVFYANASEKKDIEESIDNLKKQGIETKKIVTKMLPLKKYYEGENITSPTTKKIQSDTNIIVQAADEMPVLRRFGDQARDNEISVVTSFLE